MVKMFTQLTASKVKTDSVSAVKSQSDQASYLHTSSKTFP